jgi:hypothetical protein
MAIYCASSRSSLRAATLTALYNQRGNPKVPGSMRSIVPWTKL